MRALAGWIVAIGWMSNTAAAAAQEPVRVVSADQAWSFTGSERLLYTDADLAVVAAAQALPADIDDLYAVNTSNRLSVDSLTSYGEVRHFAPRQFALMHLAPAQVAPLAAKLHSEGLACGVLTKLALNHPLSPAASAPTPIRPVDQKLPRVAQLLATIDQAQLAATIDALTALPTRYVDTGSTVATLLAKKYEALRGSRDDVTITTYDHGDATAQRSLIVRIQGTTRPDEVLILGSHLDSVNWVDGTSERAPGADDNASGSATNLEIFRLLMNGGVHPQRTIEIHAYAAEEVGLLGSQDLAAAYRQRGVNVVGMVQFDMDLYTPPDTERKIWFISNNSNADLNVMLGQLLDTYIGLPWEQRYLGAGSSDHASWHRAGFAVAFPFEDPGHYNPHIHSADDTTAGSGDLQLAGAFAKLGAAYLLHFAGFD